MPSLGRGCVLFWGERMPSFFILVYRVEEFILGTNACEAREDFPTVPGKDFSQWYFQGWLNPGEGVGMGWNGLPRIFGIFPKRGTIDSQKLYESFERILNLSVHFLRRQIHADGG